MLECKFFCLNADNGFTCFKGDDVLETNFGIKYIVTESVTVIEDGGQNTVVNVKATETQRVLQFVVRLLY